MRHSGERFCVITGNQGEVYREIDEYFDHLQREIDRRNDNLLAENNNLLLHPHFERRTRGTRPLEFQHDVLLRPENAVHMLLYKDRVVAVVTEQRTENNYVQFSFFDHLEEIVGESGK